MSRSNRWDQMKSKFILQEPEDMNVGTGLDDSPTIQKAEKLMFRFKRTCSTSLLTPMGLDFSGLYPPKDSYPELKMDMSDMANTNATIKLRTDALRANSKEDEARKLIATMVGFSKQIRRVGG